MLARKLRMEFPGAIVPPCPEKNQMAKRSADFIETRRQALEVFINKICGHRDLKHAELLQTFLEADESTWQMEMQRMKQSEGETGTVLGTVTQIATDLMQSTKNLAKGQSDDRGEDPEYLQVRCSPLCVNAPCIASGAWLQLRVRALLFQATAETCSLLQLALSIFPQHMMVQRVTKSEACFVVADSGSCAQFKEYSTHLDHHLRDASARASSFVAKQQAYGEALAAFGTQAANMSKYEESTAASAFMDLQAAASAVATMHNDVSTHVNRYAASAMMYSTVGFQISGFAARNHALRQGCCHSARACLKQHTLWEGHVQGTAGCRIFAAPMKEQHLAIKSAKDTQHDRSVALAHKAQTDGDVKAAKARLAHLRSSGKPEAVLNVRF